jgi:uncharacterized phiE125 gp8 family phage protein
MASVSSVTLGEVLILNFYTYNASGVAANATSVTCTITLPNGTTTTGTVTNVTTGQYQCQYQPAVTGHFGVYWQGTGTNATAKEDAFNVESSTVSAPVSLTDVKTHLNITGNGDDGELIAMTAAAVGLIEGQVGPITRRTVTDTLDGGRSSLLLSTAPVASVTTVVENGSTLTSTAFDLDGEAGVLRRLFGNSEATWADGAKNVTVTYVAGRTDVPADLRHAVLETVRHLWTTQRGSVRRSGTDDYQPGAGFSLPYRVREMLSRWEQVN